MMKKQASKRAFALVAVVALSCGAAACNTVKGIGEDIKSVGEAGEKALDEV